MSTNSTATARGLLGRKIGMTQVWDADNKIIPVTVIAADTNVVTQIRTRETDGYSAVQLGFGEIDGRKVNKPVSGHFAKAGVTPRRHIVEIRTELVADYTLGQEISPEIFAAGDVIDVTATSKGKGFAGVMKRHGFHGVGASHGAHRNHRKPGSIGACATPGRVFKGLQAWPVTWAPSRSPRRTSRFTRSTSPRASSSSRAPYPAPRAHSSSSAPL